MNTRRRLSAFTPAFTLVELLVVIGIIAVLIGILLPALGRARAQARMIACQANLRSVGQAVQIYVANNKGILPIGDWRGGVWDATGATQLQPDDDSRRTRWPLLLQAVLSKYGSTWATSSSSGGDTAKLRQMFQCPDAPGEGNVSPLMMMASIDYQGHPVLFLDLNGNFQNPLMLRAYPMAKIRRSSEIGMIWDAARVIDPATGIWHTVNEYSTSLSMDKAGGKAGLQRPPNLLSEWERANPQLNPDDSISMVASQAFNASGSDQFGFTNKDVAANANNIRFRHINDTKANVLMADGHVQSFTYDKRKASDSPNVTDFKRKNLYVNRP